MNSMARISTAIVQCKMRDKSGKRFAIVMFRYDPALSHLPIVVFTGRELSPDEDAQLRMIARSIIVKGVVSPERLLDETALFLHRVIANLPEGVAL